MGMKFAPGGHSTFFAMLNTFVHIVMYFYYMIAAMGPKYQKYIWWKKYLTAFQMVKNLRFCFYKKPEFYLNLLSFY
jgi:elongation of very long chain fatty acids protein 7